MRHTQLSRVVREYVLWVDELDYTVKGRVCEVIEDGRSVRFDWQVSHNYKPSASAIGPYYPSAVSALTAEEAEGMMLAYLQGFTSIGVVKNEHY